MTLVSNLQALRGVAAAMVVAHHCKDFLAQSLPMAKDIHLGAAGVDIFFVLSGVVITLSASTTITPQDFMLRRIVRVVPMYWLALVPIGLFLLVGLSPVGVTAQDGTIANYLKSMFFVPFERSHGAIMPLLGVGWTLNYEMFFYLVFAMSLILPVALRGMAIVGVIGGLVLAGIVFQPEQTQLFFYTNPILLEFVAGVILARWWMKTDGQTVHPLLGWGIVGAGAALFVIMARPEGFDQLAAHRVLIFGVPAMLVVLGALLLHRANVRAEGRFWELMGAASYAVYLFHPILLQILEKIALKLGLEQASVMEMTVLAVAAFVISQAVGTAIHLLIEIPITRKLGRALRQKRPVLPSAAV